MPWCVFNQQWVAFGPGLHNCITLLCWTFVEDPVISDRQLRHERAHMQHQLVTTVGALLLALPRWPSWWTVAALGAYPAAYALSSLVGLLRVPFSAERFQDGASIWERAYWLSPLEVAARRAEVLHV